jgi:hypothetical protein
MSSVWQKPLVHWMDIDTGLIQLRFEPMDGKQHPFNGAWQVIGGIAPPVPAVDAGRLDDGVMLVVGRRPADGMVAVFEETKWLTVPDYFSEDTGEVEVPGLWRAFSRGWGDYFAETWCFACPHREMEPYSLDVYRLKTLKPRPKLMSNEIDCAGDAPSGAVMALEERGLLRYRAGGIIHGALPATPGRAKLPAWLALLAAVTQLRLSRRGHRANELHH